MEGEGVQSNGRLSRRGIYVLFLLVAMCTDEEDDIYGDLFEQPLEGVASVAATTDAICARGFDSFAFHADEVKEVRWRKLQPCQYHCILTVQLGNWSKNLFFSNGALRIGSMLALRLGVLQTLLQHLKPHAICIACILIPPPWYHAAAFQAGGI